MSTSHPAPDTSSMISKTITALAVLFSFGGAASAAEPFTVAYAPVYSFIFDDEEGVELAPAPDCEGVDPEVMECGDSE